MAQMKEQIKTPKKELIKMEISNLSDAKFKTLVISMMLHELRGRVDKLKENFNSMKKDMETKKMNQTNEGYTNWNEEQFIGEQQ